MILGNIKDAKRYFCTNEKFEKAFEILKDLDESASERITVEDGVFWERNGGEIKLIVEKAEELFGEIKLPAGYVFKDTKFTFKNLQSGEYTVLDMNYQDEHIIEV